MVELTDLKSGKRGRPTKVYRMNEMQATLLIPYMDNTEVVREFKIRLVEQFFACGSFYYRNSHLSGRMTGRRYWIK